MKILRQSIFALLVSVLVISITPATTISPQLVTAASLCKADYNSDNKVDAADFSVFSSNYKKTGINCALDLAGGDCYLDTKDFSALASEYNSPSCAPITAQSGIWISQAEIMALPMSGAAWDRLLAVANGGWESANLGDNNSKHDTNTLAGALVAARKNDTAMRNKVIAALQAAMNSSLTRTLELSRGLQSYIIAADIINYRDTAFQNWVRAMVNNTSVSPHNGGSIKCNTYTQSFSCSGVGGLICTAVRSPNNWGGHARASLAAAAIYLNDATLKDTVVRAHKAFIGMPVTNGLHCDSTNWHADSTNRYGVNKLGATIQGYDVSGVLPEDWRRGSEFRMPPVPTDYMWEGMQGYVVTAVILHRAGLVPFNSGDNAVLRSMNHLYNDINTPAVGDDTWIPWLVNQYAGANYPTTAATAGKGMGWTDWTSAK